MGETRPSGWNSFPRKGKLFFLVWKGIGGGENAHCFLLSPSSLLLRERETRFSSSEWTGLNLSRCRSDCQHSTPEVLDSNFFRASSAVENELEESGDVPVEAGADKVIVAAPPDDDLASHGPGSLFSQSDRAHFGVGINTLRGAGVIHFYGHAKGVFGGDPGFDNGHGREHGSGLDVARGVDARNRGISGRAIGRDPVAMIVLGAVAFAFLQISAEQTEGRRRSRPPLRR